MEKKIVEHEPSPRPASGTWLDVESCARVKLTSEDPAHPIEAALMDRPGAEGGWRAAGPGSQMIWVQFDPPQDIRQIRLRFEVPERRTQEFVLLWSGDGVTFRDIVRQQFNFSPDGASREEENYFPSLKGVTDLKLTIVPDISGGDACASLREFRIA